MHLLALLVGWRTSYGGALSLNCCIPYMTIEFVNLITYYGSSS
jgi:hypothetical protein